MARVERTFVYAPEDPDEEPTIPFYIGSPGVMCWVVQMPDEVIEDPLDEAWVDWSQAGRGWEPIIAMRVYDERVLLHEVMHVAFKRAKPVIAQWIDAAQRAPENLGDVFMAEEGIVRALTSALWGMGWRWKVRDRSAEATERDLLRANGARERVVGVMEAEARADHATHGGEFEGCAVGVCGLYAKVLVAARQ